MNLPPTPTVSAVREIEKLKGSSGAHVFLCEDGKERVVKFFDGTKAVVNEFLGHKLARALGLPAPADAFVLIPQSVISAVPDLAGRRVQPGLHYGTEFDRLTSDLERLAVTDPKQVQNASCLPGVVLLNNIVINTDTGNQNHLLTPTGTEGYNYSIVDLAGSAGTNWTPQTLQATSTTRNLVGTHPLLVVTVTGIESFSPYVERAEALTRESLFAFTESIPTTWNVKAEEKTAWVEFVFTRSKMVREIILSNVASFPSWRKQV